MDSISYSANFTPQLRIQSPLGIAIAIIGMFLRGGAVQVPTLNLVLVVLADDLVLVVLADVTEGLLVDVVVSDLELDAATELLGVGLVISA